MKKQTNEADEYKRLCDIVNASIADVITFDPMTGRHGVLPPEAWSDRAKNGITVQTDTHGKIKSISTRDKIAALTQLVDMMKPMNG